MQLSDYSKKELVEIASWYNVELPSSMLKSEMVQRLEVILSQPVTVAEGQPEEVQMSVRVKRIKEQKHG